MISLNMLNNSNMDFIWLCNTAIQFLILKSVKLLLHSIFPDDTIKQGSRMNAEHSHSYLDQPFQSSSQIRVALTRIALQSMPTNSALKMPTFDRNIWGLSYWEQHIFCANNHLLLYVKDG